LVSGEHTASGFPYWKSGTAKYDRSQQFPNYDRMEQKQKDKNSAPFQIVYDFFAMRFS
jgi:hypothetical protein